VDELVEEWQGTAAAFDPLAASAPPNLAGALAADVLQHELDLRGLLGAPPGESMLDAVDFGLNFMLGFLDRRIAKAGLPALGVRAGNQEWTLGPGSPGAEVTTTPLELFRVVAGRRSAAQVRGLAWRGDPAPYLDVLSAFGPLSPVDVAERLG
jgi:hypothetical protein